MAFRAAAIALCLLAAGPATAADFAVRTAGPVTAVAVDRSSIRTTGHFRSGWTYELYRERNPLIGARTQITGVLLVADCQTLLSRKLKVVHYLADGRALSRAGPDAAWTDMASGSNAELALRALCQGPDAGWARRKADTVFGLYRQVWR